MSALDQLDRYIRDNEVTLLSICKQKLSRTPDITNDLRGLRDSNGSGIGTSYPSFSLDNELQSFITKLKQRQKYRMSQLQQAHALFLHEMSIEDQFNMDIRTADEHNTALAEEEFEAFLLGQTSPNFVIDDAKENITFTNQPSAPSHTTLFTKQNMSVPSNLSTPALDIKEREYSESKTETSEMSLSFTDDVVLQLHRNRMDRAQRLRLIATSIQCTQAQSTNLSSSIRNSDTINVSEDAFLPPPPPPVPPPPAQPLTLPLSTGRINPAEAYFEAGEAITLQSILEDDLFAVSRGTSAITNNSVNIAACTNIPAPATATTATTHSAPVARDHPQSGAVNSSQSYLPHNRSRKALEEQLSESARNNLSLSSIHSQPQQPVPRSPTARPAGEKGMKTTTEGVPGIGFGFRYQHNKYNKHSKHSSSSSSNLEESLELHWEESSVDSGLSEGSGNVRHLEEPRARQALNRDGSYIDANHDNHKAIFDYADALESPEPKATRKSHYPHHGTGTNISTNHLSADHKQIVFADPVSAPVLSRATEVQHRVSSYYQRRMHMLEHGSEIPAASVSQPSPKSLTDTGRDEHKPQYPRDETDNDAGGRAVYDTFRSPERNHRDSGSTFASPVPKTPTFPPIFS